MTEHRLLDDELLDKVVVEVIFIKHLLLSVHFAGFGFCWCCSFVCWQ